MARSDDEIYTLEEILEEFKSPEKPEEPVRKPDEPSSEPAALQTPVGASEPAVPHREPLQFAPKTEPEHVKHMAEPEKPEAHPEEPAAPRGHTDEKPENAARPAPEQPADEMIFETIMQIQKENKQKSRKSRPKERPDPPERHQSTMKFPAVEEMAHRAERAPRKPKEPLRQEPLDFVAYTKRDPGAHVSKEESKKNNLGNAPWRTKAEQPKHQSEPDELPRMRNYTITSDGRRVEVRPDLDDPDYDEPEKPRKPKKKLPYDLINVPAEDAGQKANKLGKRLGGMAARLLLFVPALLTVLYLTLSAGYGLPMPAGFSYTEAPEIHLWIYAGCHLLTLLLCWETTASGLWRLFHGRPTLDTVVTLSGLAGLAYCIVSVFLPDWRAGLPYTSAAVLTGFFSLMSKRQRYEGLRRNYKALTMGTMPAGIKLYSDGKVQDVAVKTQRGVDVEVAELAEPDFTERYSVIFTPIALVLAAGLAVSAAVVSGQPKHFLWGLSAILSVGAPMCLLVSSSAAAKRLGRKLYTSGSMLVNGKSAGILAHAHAAVTRDPDLFPLGSVRITGMKVAENTEAETVVGFAASLLESVGGGLSQAFTEFARQMYIVPNRARELRFFDTRGISGTVSGHHILLGTANFLMRMGIRVHTGLELTDTIFIAIDSKFAGIFSLRYEEQPAVYSAFAQFRRSRIRPVLALRDTNMTPESVESRFDLKRDFIYQPDFEDRLEYSSSAFGKDEKTLALLSRDGLLAFAEVLAAAKKWKKAARISCVIGTLCTFFGMLILAFLAGKEAFVSAHPVNVCLYLLLWSLPAKLLRGIVTRL